jgi:hypothetical protein
VQVGHEVQNFQVSWSKYFHQMWQQRYVCVFSVPKCAKIVCAGETIILHREHIPNIVSVWGWSLVLPTTQP